MGLTCLWRRWAVWGPSLPSDMQGSKLGRRLASKTVQHRRWSRCDVADRRPFVQSSDPKVLLLRRREIIAVLGFATGCNGQRQVGQSLVLIPFVLHIDSMSGSHMRKRAWRQFRLGSGWKADVVSMFQLEGRHDAEREAFGLTRCGAGPTMVNEDEWLTERQDPRSKFRRY
ncbi:uncharacterized protein LY79DRAFT_39695 [Colletotrichum navitas]|uniref:Uncharacterized protein n=1 Tax=Colletotrichum navitas TaxID=681940 RepID=A0AAD8PN94_9PEZI|nr:uncharacterized protein LY79DRAFT_39695 [Colletotrichum navitas]KAK1572869.1 hypothetical protein LY79DRAFT_39695 [Colletotrichum navitas]